jgi:transcriptional pleiotropic regulator of transition state genes
MKSTGIIRKVDNLGRIVLPVELRRQLDIDVKSDVEIFVDGGQVILRKYAPNCVFCGSTENLVEFEEKNVCVTCVGKLAALK